MNEFQNFRKSKVKMSQITSIIYVFNRFNIIMENNYSCIIYLSKVCTNFGILSTTVIINVRFNEYIISFKKVMNCLLFFILFFRILYS